MEDRGLNLLGMLLKRGVIQFQLFLQLICYLIFDAPGELVEVLKDTIFHFLSRLIRKSNRKNMFEVVGLVP